MTIISPLIVYFLAALAAAAVLTPICRAVAIHFKLVAQPSAQRWHKRPTALMGGVAIALPVLALGLTLRPLDGLWRLIACSACIAVFGVLDDVLSLKPSTKLIAQILIASALLFFGYRLGWTTSLIADSMLTVFWIVGITNAFNLLDNMDGLCAGTAIIAGTFVLIAVVSSAGIIPLTLYLAALIGATTGFLAYNLYPASIFMGDAGSLFLGLNLAALTLMLGTGAQGKSSLLTVVIAPVLLLLIPILDTTLVTAGRLLSGRRPSQGGRDHTSHRLVAIGLSQRMAVSILWVLTAAGGGIAVLFQARDPSWPLILAMGFGLAMAIFAVHLGRVRVYEDPDLLRVRDIPFTPLVANVMYKRRIAEVLLDLCLVPLAYYTAYRLRFEGDLLFVNYAYFIQSLPIVLSCQLLALFAVGGYRGTWRYFGMMDAVVFAKGVILGTVAAQLTILYVYRYEHYSRTVFVIYAALLLLLLAGSRASFRLIGEFVSRRTAAGRRCIIYGTAGASLATIREAFGVDVPLRLLGFIDDEPSHRRMRVGGYSVIGGYDALWDLITASEVDCVVLNSPQLDAEPLQRLEYECRKRGVDLLKLHLDLKPLPAAS